jgi:hypothetical protein
MELDSVRELKAALHESVIVPMATSFVDRSAGLRAQLRPFFGLLSSPPEPAPRLIRRFHGAVKLDPIRLGRDASKIADEIVSHLSGIVRT